MSWDKANSISPPHHINFLTIEGFGNLFMRAGLANVEVLTPGVLDADIVRNTLKKDPLVLKENRFVRKLLSSKRLFSLFLKFLVTEKLSSRVLVFSQKV